MGTKPRSVGGFGAERRLKVSFVLDKPRVQKLQALAAADGCSVATILRKMVISALREQEAS